MTPNMNDVILLEECVVNFYRADKNTPITYKNIEIKELDEKM